MNRSRILFTDLDGTLLSSEKALSERNRSTLGGLANRNVIRVVITGRSPYSAAKVITADWPIDYLIASSGAGIFDFKKNELIHTESLSERETQSTVDILRDHNFDFMVHALVPDNHHFEYHHSGQNNPDFHRRCALYCDFSSPIAAERCGIATATQLLVVNRPNEIPEEIQEQLKELLPDLTVIRTTSPLDHKTIWFEIFPQTVSKSQAAQNLCERLKVLEENSMAVGNDYNDLDLLEWAEFSFAVGNTPKAIKDKFQEVADHDKDGFSEAVELWLGD